MTYEYDQTDNPEVDRTRKEWRAEEAKKLNGEKPLSAKVAKFPKEPKLKFKLLRDIQKDPPKKTWCVKGIIALGETSAWIAPPGKLKSALIAEAAYAIASRAEDWHGYKIKTTGGVVYFALERVSLVERRLVAYQRRDKNEVDVPIAVVPGLVDLTNPAIVADVLEVIRHVEAATGVKVVMLVIDTFAKTIAAGGGDEDKAKDQGKVFANLQRIKDALGELAPHISLIGHTGKNEDRGSRGSNAIVGDVDLMVTITGDKIKTLTSTKANDGEERPLFSFKSVLVEDGTDEDGDPETINLVGDDDIETVIPSKPQTISPKNKLALAALDEVVLTKPLPVPAELGLVGIYAARIDDWKAELIARDLIKRASKNDRTDMDRIKERLAVAGLIGVRNGVAWRAKND